MKKIIIIMALAFLLIIVLDFGSRMAATPVDSGHMNIKSSTIFKI